MIEYVAAKTESSSVQSKPLEIEFQNDDFNAVFPCKTEIKLNDVSGESASSPITSGEQLNLDEGIEVLTEKEGQIKARLVARGFEVNLMQ